MTDKIRYLPMREWLELGQALADIRPVGPKYFRAYSTDSIKLGGKAKLKADGKTYRTGTYVLKND